MSGYEWIHCNKCYARFQKDGKFFLTGCGHLNCQKCVVLFENNGKKCVVCNMSTRAVELSNELSRDMLIYFQPIDESIEQLKKVVKFQMKNMSALLVNVSNKYTLAKHEVMKSYKVINDLKKENQRLKSLLKVRNQLMSDAGSSIGLSNSMGFNTSTPRSNNVPSSPCLGNTTLISSVHSPAPFGKQMPYRPFASSQYLYPTNNTTRRF